MIYYITLACLYILSIHAQDTPGVLEMRGNTLFWKPEPPPFENREHAGSLLGKQLIQQYGIEELKEAVVLGCPRGGMVYAKAIVDEIRKEGGSPQLDLIIARKIPLPHDEECGIGAIGEKSEPFYIDNLLTFYHVDLKSEAMECAIKKVKREIERRVEAYRQGKPMVSVGGKVVIIVDGVSSGATMIACVRSVQNSQESPRRIIVATPVSSERGRNTIAEFTGISKEDICTAKRALAPKNVLWDSSDFYKLVEFQQMTDQEVRDIIQVYRSKE